MMPSTIAPNISTAEDMPFFGAADGVGSVVCIY